MEEDILKKLEEQEKKTDEILQAVRKIKSYIFWNLMAVIFFFVVPLVILLLVVPWFIKTLLSGLEL